MWAVTLWRGRAQAVCGVLGEARRDPIVAINIVFGKQYREQAKSVAHCESRFNPNALNAYGYAGLFQMGRNERARWGHGADPLTQSQAAYRYFAATGFGWGPWDCQPDGSLQRGRR